MLAGMSTAPVLSAAAVAAFHVEGFLALPPLTTPDELERLRVIYDGLFARRVGRDTGDQFDLLGDDGDPERPRVPQILSPERYAPELRATTLWRQALAVFAQLLGGAPAELFCHAICKPPGSPVPTPWHQDEAYWDPARDSCSASLWVPLQAVDATTGCMQFVPRSHFGELLPHRSAGGDPRVHGLELVGDPPVPADVVTVPLVAGAGTIHHQRTLHATGGNRGAQPRRALILVASAAPRRRRTPRAVPWQDAWQTARAARAAGAAS